VLLGGPLGAGKTTLAKGIALALGVTETVTSPTYTIVSDYVGRLALHHIDLYRIAGEEDFEQLGLEELFDGPGVSVVEWPERAGGSLPAGAESITIEIRADGRRRITGPDRLLAAGDLHHESPVD
jgi:tRNA threonylcarbamoyladenosine biosynthesis protein TsaE